MNFLFVKYNKAYFLTIALFAYTCNFAIAQEDKSDIKKDNFIEQRVEQISENADNPDIDYSNLIEDLQYFQNHPINLNTVKAEDLKMLGILT